MEVSTLEGSLLHSLNRMGYELDAARSANIRLKNNNRGLRSLIKEIILHVEESDYIVGGEITESFKEKIKYYVTERHEEI